MIMVVGGAIAFVVLIGLGAWRSWQLERIHAEAEAKVAAEPPPPKPTPKIAPVEEPLPGVIDRRQSLQQVLTTPAPRPRPAPAVVSPAPVLVSPLKAAPLRDGTEANAPAPKTGTRRFRHRRRQPAPE